jgi:hypothetical protein
MIHLFSELPKFLGCYSGVGINHENKEFLGQFELTELFDGKGYQIKFLAHAIGSPTEIFHSEVSTIARNIYDHISLFNFNTNMPFLAEHFLISSEGNSGFQEFIFRYGDIQNKHSFRQEIKLELMLDGQVGYHYSWGLTNSEFAYRSGVAMTKGLKEHFYLSQIC